jgi:diguanylate cyclase (GGDEF)-like protein
VVDDLDELATDVAEAARQAGLRGCRVVPVPDLAGGAGATITVWATFDGPPLSIHTYALDSMRRLLALVLRWRQQVRQLTSASLTDHLTGVASRSRFFAALEPPARDGAGPLTAILYVDLDRFKPVNDRHGHRTGDEVLKVIAERLNAVVRPSDLVARIGGDEFAILCRGLTDVSEATAIADRVIATVGHPVGLSDLEVVVEASVGIASTSEVEIDGDALLDAADRALYRAKREGRGRWSLG